CNFFNATSHKSSGTFPEADPVRGRQVVRAEPMSTLDAELNDFGAQLAMLGGHAADRDGEAEAARPGTARIEKACRVLCLDLGLVGMTINHHVDLVGGLGVKLGQNV